MSVATDDRIIKETATGIRTKHRDERKVALHLQDTSILRRSPRFLADEKKGARGGLFSTATLCCSASGRHEYLPTLGRLGFGGRDNLMNFEMSDNHNALVSHLALAQVQCQICQVQQDPKLINVWAYYLIIL
jgi:hypothetical protein